jgi:hypothetical protein
MKNTLDAKSKKCYYINSFKNKNKDHLHQRLKIITEVILNVSLETAILIPISSFPLTLQFTVRTAWLSIASSREIPVLLVKTVYSQRIGFVRFLFVRVPFSFMGGSHFWIEVYVIVSQQREYLPRYHWCGLILSGSMVS